jgi:hypothetical protein
MRFTFIAGTVFTMAGTALALAGIATETRNYGDPGSKLSSAGFVLFCGAGMLALLSLCARRIAPVIHETNPPSQTPS